MPVQFDPLRMLLFAALLAGLMAVVFLQILSVAFYKLGLSPAGVFLLLFGSLAGSGINLPLAVVESAPRWPDEVRDQPGLTRTLLPPFEERTVIAINVGGCVVPMLFSLYLIVTGAAALPAALAGIAVVAAVSYALSRPVYGIGIGMPLLVAPVTAALIGIVLGGEQRAALAYVAGTTGVLLGADLLKLRQVGTLGAPLASIGGAGTFDGIFLTGVLAVLLS
jgi:uncharacterized membrane protein